MAGWMDWMVGWIGKGNRWQIEQSKWDRHVVNEIGATKLWSWESGHHDNEL